MSLAGAVDAVAGEVAGGVAGPAAGMAPLLEIADAVMYIDGSYELFGGAMPAFEIMTGQGGEDFDTMAPRDSAAGIIIGAFDIAVKSYMPPPPNFGAGMPITKGGP